MSPTQSILDPAGADWQEKLALVVATMREMSLQTDPQAMVRAYGARMRQMLPVDAMVSLSRRDLLMPRYRITRASAWKNNINPWKEKDRLPILEGGLLADLIYGDQPRIMDELAVVDGDPAAEYLIGQKSLMAIPIYDRGLALNMVVWMRKEPAAFSREQFPEWVWLTNLFGRATSNLVLADEVHRAYEAIDREMKVVEDIQRSLLPAEVPVIPTMELAIHYHTSRHAGGDYYDFFPLPEGKWGILIADVSGHGTPAAVLMAITHSIAHSHPGPPTPPGKILEYVNHHLVTRYTARSGTFVTAFYGIYDPKERDLSYACAGHNPPRLKRCGEHAVVSLDRVHGLPLGISATERYAECTQRLQPGDQVVFYTDGIIEADNAAAQMFGVERVDRVLAGCGASATDVLERMLAALEQFTAGRPAADDRTLLIATIS